VHFSHDSSRRTVGGKTRRFNTHRQKTGLSFNAHCRSKNATVQSAPAEKPSLRQLHHLEVFAKNLLHAGYPAYGCGEAVFLYTQDLTQQIRRRRLQPITFVHFRSTNQNLWFKAVQGQACA